MSRLTRLGRNDRHLRRFSRDCNAVSTVLGKALGSILAQSITAEKVGASDDGDVPVHRLELYIDSAKVVDSPD